MSESVPARLAQAMNRHDAVAMAALFDAGYRSEQPAHPDRAFGGSAQVLENWTSMFEGVPDFTAELVRSADGDGWSWTEWFWSGTHTDGAPFAMAGVILFRVAGGAITAARLYMEPVETEGGGIQAAVRALARPLAGGPAPVPPVE